MKKILIIQTAFIGDVVLATVLIEKLRDVFPESELDFLLRKGNTTLLAENQKVNNILVWNKRKNKYLNLLKLILKVRNNKYDLIVNAHRFSSSGLITYFSGATRKIGFDKNPLSFCYDVKVKHDVNNGKHEIERNLELISEYHGKSEYKPKLYLSEDNINRAKEIAKKPYVVFAPASVWFTKQLPLNKWLEIIKNIPSSHEIYLIGAGNDVKFCENIINESRRDKMTNLSGKLSFLESAALMKFAEMNFVNDSAPMHFASSVNAPTTAIFCSTIPGFGFGPLSENSTVLQINEELDCRPCGLHGFKRCPKGHFNCAHKIIIPKSLF